MMYHNGKTLFSDKHKRSKAFVEICTSVLRYLFLISVSYIVLFPMFSAISTSVKTIDAFYDPTLYWLPKYTTLENFKTAFNALDYGTSVLKTLSMNMLSAAIEVFTCAVVAYGFARFNFKFKRLFEVLLFATIIIPTQIYMVSMVVGFKSFDVLGILGLINNLTGVDLRVNILNTNLTFYLPSLFAMGLRSGILIYIYIQFFSGLPKELEEAAYIDGAGPFKTFIKIAIPSSTVVILTVSVFSAIWHWNDYYLSTMYITSNYPLAVRLANINETLRLNNPFTGGAATAMINSVSLAACILFILPLLIAYLCVQNKFVKSIDRVGITG